MAFAVTSTVERRLSRTTHQNHGASTGSGPIPVKVYLPWEKRYREVSEEERPPVCEYLKVLSIPIVSSDVHDN